jgi:hypothetical protein
MKQRCRRIAPAYERPRTDWNNKADEPTSGGSTHYGSEHLNRAFRDIGHIFSSLRPLSLMDPFLSRFAPARDLLLCAKYLFVVATVTLTLIEVVHAIFAGAQGRVSPRMARNRFRSLKRQVFPTPKLKQLATSWLLTITLASP